MSSFTFAESNANQREQCNTIFLLVSNEFETIEWCRFIRPFIKNKQTALLATIVKKVERTLGIRCWES